MLSNVIIFIDTFKFKYYECKYLNSYVNQTIIVFTMTYIYYMFRLKSIAFG